MGGDFPVIFPGELEVGDLLQDVLEVPGPACRLDADAPGERTGRDAHAVRNSLQPLDEPAREVRVAIKAADRDAGTVRARTLLSGSFFVGAPPRVR